MSDAPDEILDDEWIMRRIPANPDLLFYEPKSGLRSDAFKPHRTRDEDGLSVSRMRSDSHPGFLTPEIAAESGQSKAGYYFAIVLVQALREEGLEVVAAPTPEDPGHALIVSLRSNNRKTPEVAQWMQILAERLTIRVEGPFIKETQV